MNLSDAQKAELGLLVKLKTNSGSGHYGSCGSTVQNNEFQFTVTAPRASTSTSNDRTTATRSADLAAASGSGCSSARRSNDDDGEFDKSKGLWTGLKESRVFWAAVAVVCCLCIMSATGLVRGSWVENRKQLGGRDETENETGKTAEGKAHVEESDSNSNS